MQSLVTSDASAGGSRSLSVVLLAALGTCAVAGCQSASHAQTGALLGSGLGATTGAIIGHQSGHAAGGAIIGALAGGVTGGLVGQGDDLREERDAAVVRAEYLEGEQRALTNVDVVQMVQSGLSDEVILGSIQSHAACYSLTPADLASLKSTGVSDSVLLAMQRAPKVRTTLSTGSRAFSGPQVDVIVAPRPVFWFGPPRPRPWGPPRWAPPGPRRGPW